MNRYEAINAIESMLKEVSFNVYQIEVLKFAIMDMRLAQKQEEYYNKLKEGLNDLDDEDWYALKKLCE